MTHSLKLLISFLSPLDNDSNAAFTPLLDKYQQELETSIPIIKPCSLKKLRPKWLNKEIKRMTKIKFGLLCRIRACNSCDNVRKEYKKV